jgi:hypothetical protein
LRALKKGFLVLIVGVAILFLGFLPGEMFRLFVEYLISTYYYMHVLLIIGSMLVAIGLILTTKAIRTKIPGSERSSEQPGPLVVEEESKWLIEGLKKETEDLKSAVRDLQATIAELLEHIKEPKSG